jgi:hypothetical protein
MSQRHECLDPHVISKLILHKLPFKCHASVLAVLPYGFTVKKKSVVAVHLKKLCS